jgi:hypothetical protein
VCNGSGHPAAGHAVKKQRSAFLHLHHDQARFELFRFVPRKFRPMFRPGNDLTQIAHHLAAIANAQRKGVAAREKRLTAKKRRGEIKAARRRNPTDD